MLRFLLLFLLISSPLRADEPKPDVAPLISEKGKLLFEADFDAPEIPEQWVPLHGTQWRIVDGTLRGEGSTPEYQEKMIAKGDKRHRGPSPTSRLTVGIQDGILLFRFKMSGPLNEAHFGFDDGGGGTGHVGRFIVSTESGLQIQKDKNFKVKGDRNETLVSGDFNLKPDIWYWMMLEVVGDRMVAQVSGGPVLKAEHPRLGLRKGQINLPNRGDGGVIFYDQVRVWKAAPKKADR